MKKLLIVLLLASCSKQEVKPACTDFGTVEIVSKNIIKWSNPTKVTIEIRGIDGPYHGFMYPIDTSEHRVEGHATVRIRTECSEWSEWMEVNY